MKSLPKGMWKYVLLLFLLLLLAAVSSIQTISSIESVLISELQLGKGDTVHGSVVRIITAPVMALTMSFLCLAGALGLWAIRSTTETESRRRIGRFVDAMDYLSDGLMALDRKGRITGSNPMARSLMPEDQQQRSALVREAFPVLTEHDVASLLQGAHPYEVERACRFSDEFRTMRFRSQPSEDMTLVLISDVTDQKTVELQNRQINLLQLIGRVARGVAHDFNNILCAISAHASLLARPGSLKTDSRSSLDAIAKESQRGAVLARHLLELSRTGVQGAPCERLAEHVENAADLLRVALSTDWKVEVVTQGAFAPVALTAIQVEQIVLNLGILAADEFGKSGVLSIYVAAPRAEPPFTSERDFEVLILVAAHKEGAVFSGMDFQPMEPVKSADAGVIQSVVRSMLEELGGEMEALFAPGGRYCYRIGVPSLRAARQNKIVFSSAPDELRNYVAGWPILLALPEDGYRKKLEDYLKELGMHVVAADTLVAALQHVQGSRAFNAMIMDRQLLGNEARALLHAIVKLQPSASVVVIDGPSDSEISGLGGAVVFSPPARTPELIVDALVKARNKVTSDLMIS